MDVPTSELGPLLVLTDVPVRAPAVVLRAKDRPRTERVALAARQRALTERLVVASDPTIPGADGVHLAAADPWPVAPRPRWVGRSCHDAAELAAAEEEGCDYVTLSPVFPTDTKPGYGPALGLEGFAALAAGTGLPVYALGGIGARQVRACREAGAAGVAVLGAVARATDPVAAVARLLAAWGP